MRAKSREKAERVAVFAVVRVVLRILHVYVDSYKRSIISPQTSANYSGFLTKHCYLVGIRECNRSCIGTLRFGRPTDCCYPIHS